MIQEYLRNTNLKGKQVQLNENELSYIIDLIRKDKNINMLVFGLGNDTYIWKELIKGNLIFLEHNKNWIKKFNDIKVYQVKYKTKRKDYNDLISNPEVLKLKMAYNKDLPKEIYDKIWDIVFIDSPEGETDEQHGRMQSIYTASLLKARNILVHDCNRYVEALYCNRFLTSYDMVKQIIPGSLRHYNQFISNKSVITEIIKN